MDEHGISLGSILVDDSGVGHSASLQQASPRGNPQYLDAHLSSALSIRDHNVGECISLTEVDSDVDVDALLRVSDGDDDDDDIIFISHEPGTRPVKVESSANEVNLKSTPATNLICDNCNVKCSCIDTWNTHQKFCGGGGEEKKFACRFPGCGRRFASRSLSRLHYMSYHAQEAFRCNTDGCLKKFRSETAKKEHIKRDHLQVFIIWLQKLFQTMNDYIVINNLSISKVNLLT